MEGLFTNYNEYIDFLSAKAHQRICTLDKTNSNYEDEIQTAIDKCGSIFRQFGATTNYIEDIINIEIQIQYGENEETHTEDDDLSIKRESLYKKYDTFVETLPLAVKEDLEFNFKKIFDRRLRSNHTKEIISRIEQDFPKARDLTVIEIMENPVFAKANELQRKETIEEAPVFEPETVNLPYVIQIKKADESLLQPKFNLFNQESNADENSKLPLMEEEHDIPDETDISSLFNTMSDINFDDKEVSSFNEIPEIESAKAAEDLELPALEETPSFEPFTVFNNLELDEEMPAIAEKQEDTVAEDLPLIEEPEIEDENTYTMENGDCLASLAYALIDDENGWYDIFEANSDKLLERMNELGLTQNDQIQYNEEAFSGIKLTIPNVYKKQYTNQMTA